jgi:hypothetical protein
MIPRSELRNRTINMEIDCRALTHKEAQRLLECAAKNKSPLVLPFSEIGFL